LFLFWLEYVGGAGLFLQGFNKSFFYMPLSSLAYQELGELQSLMIDNIPSDQNNVWSYCWVSNIGLRNSITHSFTNSGGWGLQMDLEIKLYYED
jgi:hypothetical protein